MPEPRKHHFVPQFMLRQFGDHQGKVVVHSILSDKCYPSTTRDIGHQNDGHTLYRRDGTVDRQSLEEAMSKVEGEASSAVSQLVAGDGLDDRGRWALAWFFALQWHRSRYLLDSVVAQVGTDELSRQEAQTSILQVVMVPFFSAWYQRNDNSVRYKDRWDSIVEATMGSFTWSLCRYRDDSLVLGDQTLCLWGVRRGGITTLNAAWARHGIGIGWDDVERVTVPLTPQLGVLLTRPEAPTRLTAPAFNRATIYNARRFIVHTPTWGRGRDALTRSFTDSLEVQRRLATVFYMNQL